MYVFFIPSQERFEVLTAHFSGGRLHGSDWPRAWLRSPRFTALAIKLERKCPNEEQKGGLNVMAHAQKSDFVFRRNGRVHLNRRGASVQSTTGSRGVRISGSNAGHTMFQGSVKGTGYPLYSPVSLSVPFPCVTVCHHISTEVYYWY